jgi:uncharacterized SAM-binding protein YcdF (DUF218 family)
MSHVITQFIEPLLAPLGLIWVALLGAAIASFRSQQRRVGSVLLLVCAVMSLAGSTPLPGDLLATLERPYATNTVAAAAPADAVVMLGGGYHASSNDSFQIAFGEGGSRVIAAIDAIRQNKAGVLVLSGDDFVVNGETNSTSPLLQTMAANWVPPGTTVLTIDHGLNTRGEALRARQLADENHWKRIILVTSAFHLKRAVAVFRKAGLEVEPVACDFRSVGIQPAPLSVFPSAAGFRALDVYLHEMIGWLAYAWRGWV